MVEVNLNEVQENIIKEMIPLYGENESEVIKTIIILFLHRNIDKVEDLLYWTEPRENPEDSPIKFFKQ
jgi:hypothetical protein